MTKSRLSLFVVLTLVVLMCGSVALAGTPTFPVVAETTGGKVMGFNYAGVNYFYGIPYASAERFEMPQAVTWEGVRACLMHGEVAPQNKVVMNRFDAMNYSAEMVENENSCLVLNIMTPNLDPEVKNPLSFDPWRGFDTGASNEYVFYNGANLARSGDVVFVSVNHRLNVLGYLDLSAYGEEYRYSGNLGMLDLIFALQWVQDNIEQFGGDPNNVTIVGQSGGGSKVTTLMGMPVARGLFHKAVIQSGGSKVTRTTEQAQAETENAGDLGYKRECRGTAKVSSLRRTTPGFSGSGYSQWPSSGRGSLSRRHICLIKLTFPLWWALF